MSRGNSAAGITIALLFLFVIPSASFPTAYASTEMATSASFAVNASSRAGYGSLVQVSKVSVSFVQPKVTCDHLSSLDQAVFWLGIKDGYGGAVGTSAFCAQGSVSPVYGTVGVDGVGVKPGDVVSASVAAGVYISFDCVRAAKGVIIRFTLTDVTTGQSATANVVVTFHHCVYPLPSVVGLTRCVIASAMEGGTNLPLANFSKSKFGMDYTGASGTCSATTNGGTIVEYVMKNSADVIMAKPSALSTDLSSFKVRWFTAGP